MGKISSEEVCAEGDPVLLIEKLMELPQYRYNWRYPGENEEWYVDFDADVFVQYPDEDEDANKFITYGWAATVVLSPDRSRAIGASGCVMSNHHDCGWTEEREIPDYQYRLCLYDMGIFVGKLLLLGIPVRIDRERDEIKFVSEERMNERKPRVKVVHWWPGREYEYTCPIPPWLVRQAEQRGSLYLTYASFGNDDQVWSGSAFCCPKDKPSRRVGRNIALGRLKATAEKLGIELPL